MDSSGWTHGIGLLRSSVLGTQGLGCRVGAPFEELCTGKPKVIKVRRLKESLLGRNSLTELLSFSGWLLVIKVVRESVIEIWCFTRVSIGSEV